MTDALSPSHARPELIVISEGSDDYLGARISLRSDPTLTFVVESTSSLTTPWAPSTLSYDGDSWALTGNLILKSTQETSPGIWAIEVRDHEKIGNTSKRFFRFGVRQ